MKKMLIIVSCNEAFYMPNENGEGNTRIHTVGELIDTLKKIPRDCKINSRFSNGYGEYSDEFTLGYNE